LEQGKKSIAQRSLNAIKWNYLGTIARVFSQLVAQIAMARILGPEVVGSFGYAVILGGVLGLLIDQGMGWALVHAAEASEREKAIVFTRVMLAATLCTAGTYWFAAPIATLMGSAAATQSIRYFAPASMFMGLSIIAQAQLRKALRFKEIQISQTISYVIAYPIVGVSLAFAGFGVISLVSAWMLQAALCFFMMIRYAPHTFRFSNPFSSLPFGSYGRDILAINLVNWVVDNFGAVFVGRLFGAGSLGLYNTTLSLVKTPANHLVVNLQTVLFPTAAAARDDIPLLGRVYATALAVVLFLAIPVFAFVAVAAPAVVATLLGSKWAAASALLTPIALAMIPHVVSSITGSTLSGRGDQRVELVSQALLLLLLVACYLVLPISSVVQVCWLFLTLYVIRAIFLMIVTTRKLQLALLSMLAIFKGPTAVALVGVGAYLAITPLQTVPPLAATIAGASLFGLTGLVGLALCPQFMVAPPMWQLVERYRSGKGIAAKVARWMTR